ncbi:MAG: hypothetical protein EHM78_01930 [Myxococcaceae bacterium]|nr:MAG: hypothetical protein EHM78_01930 [Myxococcaceae bacterium]
MTEPVIVPPIKGELQPCPFCGSEAGLEHDSNGSTIASWRAYCRDIRDGCPMGMTNTIGYPRRAEASAAWNKRAR